MSESAAKALCPGQNPVGRRIRLGTTDEQIHPDNEFSADGSAYQITGIVRDTRGVQFDGSDARRVYLPLSSGQLQNYPILIRTQADPGPAIRSLDAVVSSVDPGLVVVSATLDDLLRQTVPFIASSLAAIVASGVGLLGVALACMGIYGTVAYIVVVRTREVGIRMAIGARGGDIQGLILRETARPVIMGLLTGALVAAGVAYLLRGVFYGLNTIDGISFSGISLFLLLVALSAAYPPSRRPTRMDPMAALRCE